MQDVKQLYETTVRPLPWSEQLELASLSLRRLVLTQRLNEAASPRRSVLEILEGLPGGRIFKTSAEADTYLREERDSWKR